MKNNLITLKNSIIEASYRLSLNETRLILAIISKINNSEVAEEIYPEQVFVLSVEEFGNLFNHNEKYSYEALEEAVLNLFERKIILKEETNKLMFRWVSSIYIDKENKIVCLQWSSKIIPFISKLKEEFTSIKLQYIVNLTSVNSIRIYKLLCKWKRLGQYVVEVEKLKEMLELTETYPRFSNFNQKIIVPSIESINKETDLNIKLDYIKIGKKVEKLKFTYR